MLGSGMTHETLPELDENTLLRRFEELVRDDRSITATLLRYVAEIDQRKLFLKYAYPSMFAFCVERFHMSEAIASKRIRAGRAAYRFPRIFDLLERGHLHLTAVHQLAKHLTEDNHEDVLERAKHKTMRQVEELIAEIAPKPDVPSKIVTLPTPKRTRAAQPKHNGPARLQSSFRSEIEPLSPRRYRLQVTLDQEGRDRITELQELMSHRIPDGDPVRIVNHALELLLEHERKRKAALTDKPRRRSKKRGRSRSVPASIRREVFPRDEGQCTFVDEEGNRCKARHLLEFHHKDPYGLGGGHDANNIELRCRAHNQYQADLDYGAQFMAERRASGRRPAPK